MWTLTTQGDARETAEAYDCGPAGGVGTAAGRFAPRQGAGRLLGSAGSARQVGYLTERVGFDAAFASEHVALAHARGAEFRHRLQRPPPDREIVEHPWFHA